MLKVPAKLLETLFRAGAAELGFVRPVVSPSPALSPTPSPLVMLFCYPDHVQSIERQQ